MAETILSSPVFVEMILPFILVFTIVFALLEKSQILGKGRRQIDAIVSAAIGLIVISFANAVGIITALVPFLAVSIVIILVFLILYAMVFQGEDFKIPKGLKIVITIIISVAVVVAVFITTGAWDYIKYEWVYGGDNSFVFTNLLFVVIIIAAIGFVMWGSKKNKDDS